MFPNWSEKSTKNNKSLTRIYVHTTLFCKSCEEEKKKQLLRAQSCLLFSPSSDHAWGLYASTVWVYTCAVFRINTTYLFEYSMVVLDSTWRLASFENHGVLRTTEFWEPRSFENHGALRTTEFREQRCIENHGALRISVFFQLDLKIFMKCVTKSTWLKIVY